MSCFVLSTLHQAVCAAVMWNLISFSHICTSFRRSWTVWGGWADYIHMLEKSHFQHVQKGRMTAVACSSRDVLKMSFFFFKGLGSFGSCLCFYFPFFNCLSMLSICCLFSILFSVFIKKACTITRLVSGQFRLVFFGVFARVESSLKGTFLKVLSSVTKLSLTVIFCSFDDTNLWW